MTITLFPTSQSVKIAMTQPEYDLVSAGVNDDPTRLERLLMSHCQQIQREQIESKRTMIQQFIETARPEQMTAVLALMSEAEAVVAKG